jgi:hypothetical protein
MRPIASRASESVIGITDLYGLGLSTAKRRPVEVCKAFIAVVDGLVTTGASKVFEVYEFHVDELPQPFVSGERAPARLAARRS